LGEHLKRVRLDRGLWQTHLAREFGCSTATIQNYEMGRTLPEIHHWPAILRFLGNDPRPEPTSWPERLRHVREGRGLTQADLAQHLGVDIRTVNSWENRRNRPRFTGRVAKAVKAFLDGRTAG
jgi:transcriptional regulator with XRE-family HTH domain